MCIAFVHWCVCPLSGISKAGWVISGHYSEINTADVGCKGSATVQSKIQMLCGKTMISWIKLPLADFCDSSAVWLREGSKQTDVAR